MVETSANIVVILRRSAVVGLILWSCACFNTLRQQAVGAAPCNDSQRKCGGLDIPYPFGIGPGCGLPAYRISCNENSSLGPDPMVFLALGGIFESQLNVISFSPGGLLLNATSFKASSCEPSSPAVASLTIPEGAPFFVTGANSFATLGCDSEGSFSASKAKDNSDSGGCTNSCFNAQSFPFCNGYACCVVALPAAGFDTINITGAGISYEDFPGVCGFSTILDTDTFENPLYEYGHFGAGHWSIRLGWGIPYPDKEHSNCSTLSSSAAYACSNLSHCLPVDRFDGYYVCNCSRPGYRGDGYKNGTGCENIDECASNDNTCVATADGGICTDLPGTYGCSCIDGFVGNGIDPHKSINGTGCTKSNKEGLTTFALVAIGIAAGLVVCSLLVIGLWLVVIRPALASKARRDENFVKHGGKDLRKLLSEGNFKFFSEKDLKKATKNFTEMLGRGGQGTVYKGSLDKIGDVAVKRPCKVVDSAVGDFVNEAVILSSTIHKNIVKLLGCCLETEELYLVYEYVSNGTVKDHLRRGDSLRWKERLQIALGSAEGLSYLHSSIRDPILHRDVKSSNILLDDRLTPKIADFGLSRQLREESIAADQPSENRQGTYGYFDPEYIHSGKYTDKSDVYSFGVVLLELITSEGPIIHNISDDHSNLASFCRSKWEEKAFESLIYQDMGVAENSDDMKSVMEVAELAVRCLSERGQDRPSMRSVYLELERIRASSSADHEGIERVQEDLWPSLSRTEDPAGESKGNRDDVYSPNQALEPLLSSSLGLSDDVSFSQNTRGFRSNYAGPSQEMARIQQLGNSKEAFPRRGFR